MAGRVGVVAVAQTKFEEKKATEHTAELMYNVTREVMGQTGLEFKEDGTGIDATLAASYDLFSGPAGAYMFLGYVVGAYRREDERVLEDGSLAVYYGAMQILSGHVDTVLLVSYNKESSVGKNLIEWVGMDQIYQRRIGLDFVSAAGLQAMRYTTKYGITPEQCAKVVVKSHRNAANNPYAMCCDNITVEDVLRSTMLCDPIRVQEAKPTPVDGACAIILASEEKARKITDKPVWITGFGSCYDHHELGYRDLADCEALTTAAQRAYKMAGITNPLKTFDLAEISEQYAYQELLWSEGLGFCGKGEGGKLIDSGKTQMGGDLPINPSGGMLSGLPVCVAGMQRVAECVVQLRGEAGDRQVPGAKKAVAHGVDGPAGQLQCVITLEN
ncbi:MAG TPA: thiolase family protein [Dehalococcoidia bacterium]|nr:thiolase family protein [Dehalococcoidia bacterium]